jgi:hypothetical protein
MSERKTVLLLSRKRLFDFFKAIATELITKGYHIIVCACPEEFEDWKSMNNENIEVLNFYKLCEVASLKPVSELRKIASQIEDRIGLSPYRANSLYLLTFRLARQLNQRMTKYDEEYYGSEEGTLKEYVGSYAILSDLFEKYRPDTVLYECIDFIPSSIAFVLARQYGKFAFSPEPSPLKKTSLNLGFGTYKKNIKLEYFYANRSLLKKESYEEGDNYIKELSDVNKYHGPHAMKSYNSRVSENPYFSSRVIKNLLKGRYFTRPFNNLKRYMDKIWFDKNSRKAIPEEPFLAFFMHYQPEVPTTSAAPRWVNHEVTIEQLAVNAPSWLKILAREHPAGYGTRGKNYFGPLKRLPNVILCHPIVNPYEIISKAEVVVTVSGSVGLEAIILNKKVAVLGRPFYSVYNGVKKLNYPEDVFAHLKDKSWKPEEMVREKSDFIASYMQSLFDCGKLVLDVCKNKDLGQDLTENTGKGYANEVIDMLGFVNMYNIKPTDFESGI